MADVLVAGSTGLVGSAFLAAIKQNRSFREVIAVSRREIASIGDAANIQQRIIDFDRLNDYKNELAATSTFCALGTTIKKAGTKERFRRVDYQLPLDLARIVLENNCQNFILISAVGANPDSKIFYNRIKGELEAQIQKLPFRSIHILRPSLILGQRDEVRMGEMIGKLFLQPISPLFPVRYRPIQAAAIAKKALHLLETGKAGIHIYEGAALRGSE
ncbi:MAG: NAD-dependent epimerase/dehydratase family protein [Desulfobacteraceae bacterium]|nr:MAG: NAD-dependent epimerase/dehydratase family protein [Desulfobacteraceae bacterium]